MPAVSISLIGRWRPSGARQTHSTAIESRVIPASGPVSSRSSPSSRLISVDLPGIGPADDRQRHRPGGVVLLVVVPTLVAFRNDRLEMRDVRHQRLVELGHALAMLGRDRHRLAEPERIALEDARLAPHCPRTCWRSAPPAPPARAASGAISSSSGVIPARASITNSAASAPLSETSVCARMRPGSVSASSSSHPAVSTASNSSPSSPASPNRRSRVTPGWSSTSASFLPTSRLNSVDLPTLGRPMMTTWGRADWAMSAQVAAAAALGKEKQGARGKRPARPCWTHQDVKTRPPYRSRKPDSAIADSRHHGSGPARLAGPGDGGATHEAFRSEFRRATFGSDRQIDRHGGWAIELQHERPGIEVEHADLAFSSDGRGDPLIELENGAGQKRSGERWAARQKTAS
jgi:hypothetical protein